MSGALPNGGLTYAGGLLDRSVHQRSDKDWIVSQLDTEEGLIVPMWRDLNLIEQCSNDNSCFKAVYLPATSLLEFIQSCSSIIFLGLDNGRSVFAVDFSHLEKSVLEGLIEKGEFINLRTVGALLQRSEAALLAYARGLITWHSNHIYCSRCGQPNKSTKGGHVRLCTNPKCNSESYPNIYPVVIMLVEYCPPNNDSPMCLLGRHSGLPSGVYSTLAGFVEHGESLEEAVVREVYEEVGLCVNDIIYQASQPWPFPSSIMIGFRARADSLELNINRYELEDARWFTVRELIDRGDWTNDDTLIRLSRKDSISRFLVESWIEEHSQ